MSCPTCGHTLQGIGHGYYHCPRCGTLAVTRRGGTTAALAPEIVERCRRFQDEAGADWFPAWRRLGIAEAITPPTPEAR